MKKTSKKLSLDTERVRVLSATEMQRAGGALSAICTQTCLGTACFCQPTLGPDCHTVGYTQCYCSETASNCNCQQTFINC